VEPLAPAGRQSRAVGRAHCLAAPVFGRPELASAAKLTVVAAGEQRALARVEPLLNVIGQRTWVVGRQPERANVVKLS
jgi:3-hydroxyisobutyrate dehydrogenase-like beta-hydroxyacid dehydrogenase